MSYRVHGAGWTLRIRIPYWAKNVHATVDGAPCAVGTDGFLCVKCEQAEKTVALSFDMPVTAVSVNPAVAADAARIAVQRGPFVYCAESVDNTFPLTQYRVSAADVRSAAPVTGLKDGFSGLSVPAVVQTPSEDTASLYRFDEQTTERPTALNMIPYYLWANRGARDMMVFLHTKS